MALEIQNPVTPGRRGHVKLDRSGLWKGRPEKSLTFGKKRKSGRNNHGRITTRHQGGGHRRLYRVIDFKRCKDEVEAQVQRLEYDPNRSAFIALVVYRDGVKSYILAPQNLKVGDWIESGEKADIKPGNALPLRSIPVGSTVHNVELKPGRGGQLARSAGCGLQIVGRDVGYVLLKLPSGELRKVRGECRASIGVLSNPDRKNIKLGKAGRSRWLGIRPTVRGVAMNPIDHPHGGGEGKTSGGRHPVTPWGKPTKGKKTRTSKISNRLIVKRRS